MAVLTAVILLGLMTAEGMLLHHESRDGSNELLGSDVNFTLPESRSGLNGIEICPRWSYLKNGSCNCPAHQHFLYCEDVPETSRVVEAVACSCLTYKESSEDKKTLFEFGFCIYNCRRLYKSSLNPEYHVMPQNFSYWNEYQCGQFHRTGTLCGSCDEKNGYYQRVYSFDVSCVQCSNSNKDWINYLLSAFLPLTVFCLIVLFFRINVHSSALQGYVSFCQLMSVPTLNRVFFLILQKNDILHVSQTSKFLGAAFGIWNLDFFRTYYAGYCLQTGSLATLSLEFAIAGYPFLLMLIYYVASLKNKKVKIVAFLLKPFQLFNKLFLTKWNVRTSAIDSFSTFFFLSNMKFLSASFDLLVPVKVHQFTDARQVHHVWRLYYDANIPYLQGTHLYYAILAIMVLIIFVVFPVLLLLLYPFKFFQKCLSKLPNRVVLPLHTFVDSFQGCYKDGTEPGTRDCRWFSAVLIIFRFMYLTIYAISPTQEFLVLLPAGGVILALFVINADPFKPKFFNFQQFLVVYILLASLLVLTLGFLTKRSKRLGIYVAEFYIFLFVSSAATILSVMYSMIFVFRWLITNRKFRI